MAKFVCANGILTFDQSPDFLDGSWCVNNVTIDLSSELVNYRCMGDDSWESAISSTKSSTFTWETALDDVDGIDLDNTVGVEGWLDFDTVDGLSYRSLVIITGTSINAPVDDVATVSWEATGNGDFTENVS